MDWLYQHCSTFFTAKKIVIKLQDMSLMSTNSAREMKWSLLLGSEQRNSVSVQSAELYKRLHPSLVAIRSIYNATRSPKTMLQLTSRLSIT